VKLTHNDTLVSLLDSCVVPLLDKSRRNGRVCSRNRNLSYGLARRAMFYVHARVKGLFRQLSSPSKTSEDTGRTDGN
jgi:hypothetical protein